MDGRCRHFDGSVGDRTNGHSESVGSGLEVDGLGQDVCWRREAEGEARKAAAAKRRGHPAGRIQYGREQASSLMAGDLLPQRHFVAAVAGVLLRG